MIRQTENKGKHNVSEGVWNCAGKGQSGKPWGQDDNDDVPYKCQPSRERKATRPHSAPRRRRMVEDRRALTGLMMRTLRAPAPSMLRTSGMSGSVRLRNKELVPGKPVRTD